MSVVNFKRIGQLGSDVITRFQSNVEQSFKTVNECFASIADSISALQYYSEPAEILEDSSESTYSSSNNGSQILIHAKVPKGDYYVTMGQGYVRQSVNQSCYQRFYINGVSAKLWQNAYTFYSGGASWSGHSYEGGYFLGLSNTTRITLPLDENLVYILLTISGASLIRSPWFRLEKINPERETSITNEWD